MRSTGNINLYIYMYTLHFVLLTALANISGEPKMASKSISPCPLLLLLCFCFALLVSCDGALDGDRKEYIVYMGERPTSTGDFSASFMHTSWLQDVLGSSASDRLLHSYHRSFNGFVAKLTHVEAQSLKGVEGVVSVFPNGKKQLHTTRSWDFLGFSEHVVRATAESDVIVGMLDTGIWPESESFNPANFGTPPKKWKGSCQASSNFTCNNKIIGAKFYRGDKTFGPSDFQSPRDSEGHGTHTSSTAAGGLVSKASLFGLGLGTARGGVPSARIAVYKICWSDGCQDADILAAFDDAIADGVDIISISVGGFFAVDYFEDPIAIGSFHAMKKGILTSNSGGNSGPVPASITNVAPWTLSVAASTIDREFVTRVKLGNSEIYEGISINTNDYMEKMFPLIYGGDAPNRTAGVTGADSRFCSEGSLDENLVRGKIVLCDELNNGFGASTARAAGSVMQGDVERDVAFSFDLPNSYVNTYDGSKVASYLNSTRTPTATILKSSTEKTSDAPVVVSFSSRGPNPITTDILKPDLTAPGVDILAAWTQASSPSESDPRISPFNIISGTSMSCPHATAAAAYIKSFYPSWSPAAIKSALMTTATVMSSEENSDAEFAYGSGQLNPVKAINPGLVYDAGEVDYVKFLCGQGYNDKNLTLVTGDSNSCSKVTNGSVWDLNYPSFALTTKPGILTTQVYHRTVTNVGSAVSTYRAVVATQPGLTIKVQPSVLSFKSVHQKQSFVVTITATVGTSASMISGVLIWDDGVRHVRSPIVAFIPPSI